MSLLLSSAVGKGREMSRNRQKQKLLCLSSNTQKLNHSHLCRMKAELDCCATAKNTFLIIQN